MTTLIHFFAILVLIIASIQDLKKREVMDWLNYGLFFFAISFRLSASVIESDYSIFTNGILGFLVTFAVGSLFYYTGQWGGGDAKLLFGLGALLGYSYFLFVYIAAIFVMGSLYGLIYSVYLAIKYKRNFVNAFAQIYNEYKSKQNFLVVTVMALLVLSIPLQVKHIYLSFSLLLILLFYLYLYAKAFEEGFMMVYYNPKKLTEGDWIAKEVKYRGKVIAGPKDLGVEKHQIKKIMALYRKGIVKRVLVKEGIPFVPGFLLGYIVNLYLFTVYLL